MARNGLPLGDYEVVVRVTPERLDAAPKFFVLGPPVEPGRYHNCAAPCGVVGCVGWPEQLVLDRRASVSGGR